MSMRIRHALALMLTAFVLQATTAAQTLPPAARWIPHDAVIVLELSEPRDLLELLTGEEATATVTKLPVYEKLASGPKFQEFVNVIKFMEFSLDTDWRTGMAKLTGGGITLAVCPEDTVLLIVDSEDPDMLERLHGILLNISRSEADNDGQPGRVASTQYADVTTWTFNGKEAHAIIGKRFVFANRPEGLKAALDLRAEAEAESLAANRTYQTAKKVVKPNAVGMAFANLRPLMQLPDIAQLLDQARENPLAALIFAGIAESVRDANWLAMDLHISESTLVLQASVDGKAVDSKSPAAFALPKRPGEGAPPNLAVPRRIAAVSLYRDLHQFYAAKDDLFPERTSGLIFFENMMGIFFSGLDLTNEVLSETQPEIRLVVAGQVFDPAVGTPQVKLPAFALILRLRDPEKSREIAEEAWQKAVGLINFTRGQQALPGLIIDRPVHSGTTFSVAYFSTSQIEDKTKLEQRFNFRPTLAMPGEYLILSSTDGLARDLIDTLGQNADDPVKALAGTHSVVEIDADAVASILQANFDAMVRSDMVKKGNTREQSEAGINMLLTAVKLAKGLQLSIGARESLTEARLELSLNLPAKEK